jgi:hypothetical protein
MFRLSWLCRAETHDFANCSEVFERQINLSFDSNDMERYYWSVKLITHLHTPVRFHESCTDHLTIRAKEIPIFLIYFVIPTFP